MHHPGTCRIYTIGHSNRTIDEFVLLLKHFQIETVADIRSFPGSRKFPHFNRENLQTVLSQCGIRYVWLPKLGGRRRAGKAVDSPNMGLRSPGFRNYADYMSGKEFRDGIEELRGIASQSVTVYMCAEALFWRCHRRLLSDYLVAHGVQVCHITGMNNASLHTLTEDAVLTSDGNVIYPEV